MVIRYFKKGLAAQNRHPESLYGSDAEEYLHFLMELEQLSEDMAIIQQNCLVIHGSGMAINISPFCEFIEAGSFTWWDRICREHMVS